MEGFLEGESFLKHQVIHQQFDEDGKDQCGSIKENQCPQRLRVSDIHLMFADPGESDDEPPPSVQFQGRNNSYRSADDI